MSASPFPGGPAAREVQHALDMLVDTIPASHWAAYPEQPVQRACRESFALNARLLIEFLTRAPDRRDIAATDFAPNWTGMARPPLDEHWLWACRQVAHLSLERLNDLSYDVDEAKLRRIAEDVLAVAEEWVAQVEAAGHEDAAALRSSVDSARERLRHAPRA